MSALWEQMARGVAKCAHHTRQKKNLTKPLIASAKAKRKKKLKEEIRQMTNFW